MPQAPFGQEDSLMLRGWIEIKINHGESQTRWICNYPTAHCIFRFSDLPFPELSLLKKLQLFGEIVLSQNFHVKLRNQVSSRTQNRPSSVPLLFSLEKFHPVQNHNCSFKILPSSLAFLNSLPGQESVGNSCLLQRSSAKLRGQLSQTREFQ